VPSAGKLLLTMSSRDGFQLWDVATGKEQPAGPFQGASFGIAPVFTPDGTTVAGASQFGISFYDLTAQTHRNIPPIKGEILCTAACSPDGKHVASGTTDGVVRLWDATTGAEVRKFHGHEAPVNAVSFTPDGTALVSAGSDRTVRVWDIATGKERLPSPGH